jgi:outer membrane receptor protein involved in Fe transport
MNNDKKMRSMLAACGIAAVSVPASAQTDTAAPAPDKVVVTGSRVAITGNDMPTPVTVVTADQLTNTTPSNLADGLNKMPVFNGSSNQGTVENPSTNSVGNFLNLRGIGSARTLILFDGHRLPATASSGAVDVNTLPQLLVKRVDVVTGGASAVYGSDAISGVVNFVLDKRFNGVKVVGQGSMTQQHDDKSKRFGIAAGKALLDGRGHIEGSFESYDSDGIPFKMARGLGRDVYALVGKGTAASPFTVIRDARSANYSYGGLIKSGPLAGQQFQSNGVLTPFAAGAPTSTAGVQVGGDGIFFQGVGFIASLKTEQAFGRFSYDLTDDVTAYAQISGSEAKTNHNFANFFNNYTLAADNPYLPAQARATMAAADVNSFTLGRLDLNRQPAHTESDTRNVYVDTGLTGRLGNGYDWTFALTHGVSRQGVTLRGNVNTARLAAALDAVDANGKTVCRVDVTNPGLYSGCLPLNLFGPTAPDPAAIAFTLGDTGYQLKNTLDGVSASVSGSPVSLPAGPLRLALSGDYRRIALDNVSNVQPSQRADCTGLRYNCNANSLVYQFSVVGDVHAAEHIGEAAVEAEVPLLKDVPFAKALNLNGALRYADYSVSGNAVTWKAGVDWKLSDELTLRGTRSKDFRAPTLNDLYAPVNTSRLTFTDLHTGVSGVTMLRTQGNPDLKPEVAQGLTVGAVYSPSALPRFSLAVDYFSIDINNAIATVGGADVTTQAQCEASKGASPLCALYVRPQAFQDTSAANFPTTIIGQALNVASLKTHGVDVEANYRMPVAGGRLDLRGFMSYLPKLVSVQVPGAPAVNAAGAAGLPSVKVTAFASYKHGPYSVDVMERWRNPMKQSGDPTLVFAAPKVPSVAYTDLTLTYATKLAGARSLEAFVSVQNLFDRVSPVWVNSSTPGFFYPVAKGDDLVGRNYTVGARVRF